MAITEKMMLSHYEKVFTTDEAGNPQTTEHVEYAYVIERDGVQIQAKPHRLILDRIGAPNYAMPDNTVKTTAEVIADIGG